MTYRLQVIEKNFTTADEHISPFRFQEKGKYLKGKYPNEKWSKEKKSSKSDQTVSGSKKKKVAIKHRTKQKTSKKWQKKNSTNVKATQQREKKQKSREKPTENNLLHCFMNTMSINTNGRYVCEAARIKWKRIMYLTLFDDGFSLIFPCVSIFHASS